MFYYVHPPLPSLNPYLSPLNPFTFPKCVLPVFFCFFFSCSLSLIKVALMDNLPVTILLKKIIPPTLAAITAM